MACKGATGTDMGTKHGAAVFERTGILEKFQLIVEIIMNISTRSRFHCRVIIIIHWQQSVCTVPRYMAEMNTYVYLGSYYMYCSLFYVLHVTETVLPRNVEGLKTLCWISSQCFGTPDVILRQTSSFRSIGNLHQHTQILLKTYYPTTMVG